MLAQQAPLFGFLRMAVIYLASEDGMILMTVEERLDVVFASQVSRRVGGTLAS
jgi:hypothetical protein